MQKVKIRLKINNTRYIGTVEYPSFYRRFSEFLNGEQDFLKVLHPESVEKMNDPFILLVNKKNIAYIQSIEEEYVTPPFSIEGDFFQATIRLKREETISGLIFCSYEESKNYMEGFLRQTGFFVNIKNPLIIETSEKYNFLAVGKATILTMEVDPKPVSKLVMENARLKGTANKRV